MIKNYYENSPLKDIMLERLKNTKNAGISKYETQSLFESELSSKNDKFEKPVSSNVYARLDDRNTAEKYNRLLAIYGIKPESESSNPGLNKLNGIYKSIKNAAAPFSGGIKAGSGILHNFIKNHGAYSHNGALTGIMDNSSQNITPLNSSQNITPQNNTQDDISAKFNALIKQYGIETPENTLIKTPENTLIKTDDALAAEKKYAVPAFYNNAAGKKLAKAASRTIGTGGYCLRGVNKSLYKVYGQKIAAPSAYMAADILSSNKGIGKHFTEDAVPRSFLESLPEGAVVVWDNNIYGGGANVSKSGRKHGHVSIALGNGLESSDHIQKQIVDRDAEFRVFYPNS